MKVLLACHNCYTDPTNGGMRCVRTVMRWAAEAGHEARALCTARFESRVDFTIEQHLHTLNVPLDYTRGRKRTIRRGGRVLKRRERSVVRYALDGVDVTMLITHDRRLRDPDRAEAQQYLQLLQGLLDDFRPHVLLSFGIHPVIFEGFRLAKERGITTVFTLRTHGYDRRELYRHVDAVFTTSPFMTELYRKRIGLRSTPIITALMWSEIEAPTESRAFVTYVNPRLEKGAAVFVRLADMLGSRRPDIPVLVVQSSLSAGFLNSVPGIDFTKYPQIMASPPVPRPADYFALTRLLLVPSAWMEPFGRVAAEAMINGVPAVVGDRGSLPFAVGADTDAPGGIVAPIPEAVTPDSPRIPSEEEVQPWFDAVCSLWDDKALYERLSQQGRRLAEQRYAEDRLRRAHLDFLTSAKPGGRLFDD
jgi:glycosyltransferase involved in cell wall biosynthesis